MKKIKIIAAVAHLSFVTVFLLAPMLAEAGVAPQSMSIPRFRRVFTTDQRGVQANEFRPGDVVRCVVEYDTVTAFPVQPGPYVIRWYIYDPQRPGRTVYDRVVWTVAETRRATTTLERNLAAYREYRVSKPGPLFCRVSGFEGAYDPGTDINRFPRTFTSGDVTIMIRGERVTPLANQPPSTRPTTPGGQVAVTGQAVQSPGVKFITAPPTRVLLATPTRFVWQGGAPSLEYRYRLDVPGDWKGGIRYILNKWTPWGTTQSITYSDFIVAGLYTFSVQARNPRTGQESQVVPYRFSVYFQMPQLFQEAVKIDWARARQATTKKQQYEILAQEFRLAHLAWMQKLQYQLRLLNSTVDPKWFVETLVPVPTEEAAGMLLNWADRGVAVAMGRLLAPLTLYNQLQVAGVGLILIFRRAEANKTASMALLTYYAWKGYERLTQRAPNDVAPLFPSHSFWGGTIAGIQSGQSFSERVAVELRREGNTLTGYWRNSLGETGSIRGTLAGKNFNIASTISTPGCRGVGSGQGSGQVSADGRTLAIHMSGKTCQGQFTARGNLSHA